MNTHTPNALAVNNRLASLERSSNRWRLAAVGSITLLAGLLIGGMGNQPTQTSSIQPNIAQTEPTDPKAVVGFAGTNERLYRLHHDGSLTYIRIPKGERTVDGFFNWGDVRIDQSRKSQNLPR